MILWQIAHFMQQAAISAKMCCFAALKSVHFCTNPPKKHISSLRFFHITTLCNYHSPVKNAHCTFYCLANDTFSHSVCWLPDVPLKIRSSASQNRISCSFVRFAAPFGCLPARRSFLFSCRCSISASILSAVYSKPFWFSTRAHFARHILARP